MGEKNKEGSGLKNMKEKIHLESCTVLSCM